MLEMKNEKTTWVFLYLHKIWQNLKQFSRALSWAQTSYLWAVIRHLPNTKAPLMISWQRFSFSEVNDWPLTWIEKNTDKKSCNLLVTLKCVVGSWSQGSLSGRLFQWEEASISDPAKGRWEKLNNIEKQS